MCLTEFVPTSFLYEINTSKVAISCVDETETNDLNILYNPTFATTNIREILFFPLSAFLHKI